jgi:hypothetical protein
MRFPIKNRPMLAPTPQVIGQRIQYFEGSERITSFAITPGVQKWFHCSRPSRRLHPLAVLCRWGFVNCDLNFDELTQLRACAHSTGWDGLELSPLLVEVTPPQPLYQSHMELRPSHGQLWRNAIG